MAFTPIDISTPNDGQGDTLRHAFDLTNQMLEELYTKAVFKEPGKGLSSNDFTDEYQAKLDGIEAGAEVNVQADLTQEDPSQDSYVIGKELIFTPDRTPPLILEYSGGSTFDLPEGKKVNSVMLVRTILYEGTEWLQNTNVLSITIPMTVGNRIQINFY